MFLLSSHSHHQATSIRGLARMPMDRHRKKPTCITANGRLQGHEGVVQQDAHHRLNRPPSRPIINHLPAPAVPGKSRLTRVITPLVSTFSGPSPMMWTKFGPCASLSTMMAGWPPRSLVMNAFQGQGMAKGSKSRCAMINWMAWPVYWLNHKPALVK